MDGEDDLLIQRIQQRRRFKARRKAFILTALLVAGLTAAGAFAWVKAARVRDSREQVNGAPKSGEKPSSGKPNGSGDVAGLVDVQAISEAYRTNELSAEEKFGGRRVTCEGSMHKLEKTTSGDYVMSFDIFVDGFNFRKGDVYAYFSAKDAAALSKYGFRSTVFFSGRCEGKVVGPIPPIIALRDCHIVSKP